MRRWAAAVLVLLLLSTWALGVDVTGRQVVEAALACGATRVALAHNHVSGIALCSAQDVQTTRHLSQLLNQVGVCLVDHFVIAEDEMVSMRESGYLSI